jgi:transposase
MILSHKIALDPTMKQEQYFRRAAGVARFVWNWAFAKWKEAFKQSGFTVENVVIRTRRLVGAAVAVEENLA